MKSNTRKVLVLLTAALIVDLGNALSTSSPDTANLAKGRLQESLSSFSKKMTISPEVIIPDPSDPTAILLQSTEVTNLSNALRVKAKSNAAFISGSVSAVKTFCSEQESARGNFPGPLPIVYCPSSSTADIAELADSGVSGILYSTLNGETISSVDEISSDEKLQKSFEEAIDNGMQLIPEVVLNADIEWDENSSKDLIEAVTNTCGAEPAAILLTIGAYDGDGENEERTDDEEGASLKLPKIPKCSTPIIGSVRALAGGGRMGAAVSAFKDSGFNGVVLRCDCLPGYRMNPDLEFVRNFWGLAISDLKSTKSKNFNFRSKVALERDIPMEWFNYQKDVMDSGALGGNDSGVNPLDTEKGDYQGF